MPSELKNYEEEFIFAERIENIVVFESKLSSKEANYKKLAKIDFKNKKN
jgi:hypothetical protein